MSGFHYSPVSLLCAYFLNPVPNPLRKLSCTIFGGKIELYNEDRTIVELFDLLKFRVPFLWAFGRPYYPTIPCIFEPIIRTVNNPLNVV